MRPRKYKKRRRTVDVTDDRLNISTNLAAEFLGISWLSVINHQKSGRIKSVKVGVRSQPYYRTSGKALFEFMRDYCGDKSGPSGDTEPTG